MLAFRPGHRRGRDGRGRKEQVPHGVDGLQQPAQRVDEVRVGFQVQHGVGVVVERPHHHRVEAPDDRGHLFRHEVRDGGGQHVGEHDVADLLVLLVLVLGLLRLLPWPRRHLRLRGVMPGLGEAVGAGNGVRQHRAREGPEGAGAARHRVVHGVAHPEPHLLLMVLLSLLLRRPGLTFPCLLPLLREHVPRQRLRRGGGRGARRGVWGRRGRCCRVLGRCWVAALAAVAAVAVATVAAARTRRAAGGSGLRLRQDELVHGAAGT